MADKSITDKANEQGWGSTVNAAAEQVKQTTDSIAKSLRSTVGDQLADGLKTGGEYTKAGIQNTGCRSEGVQGTRSYASNIDRPLLLALLLASLRIASTRQGS